MKKLFLILLLIRLLWISLISLIWWRWALIVANIEAQVAYIEADMAMIDRLIGMMVVGNMPLV